MTPVDVSEFVELAQQGGLPPDTIFLTMDAAVELQLGGVADLGRVDLGNGTGCEIVLTPLRGQALVSVINWNAYPFQLDDDLLHWSYVREKLTPNTCDAVALTLLLGVALRRLAGVRGGCDCPKHRGLQA